MFAARSYNVNRDKATAWIPQARRSFGTLRGRAKRHQDAKKATFERQPCFAAEIDCDPCGVTSVHSERRGYIWGRTLVVICRRSVEANNGVLSVRDLPGQGASSQLTCVGTHCCGNCIRATSSRSVPLCVSFLPSGSFR